MNPEIEALEGRLRKAVSRSINLAALMLCVGVMLIAQGAGSDESFAVKMLMYFLAAMSFGFAVRATVNAAGTKAMLDLADTLRSDR